MSNGVNVTSASSKLISVYDIFLTHRCSEDAELYSYFVSTLCSVLIFSLFLFYFCWLPMDKFVDLEKKGKRNAIQRARIRRNLGDMPPSYPNGWFVLLESVKLKPGCVRHIALLGEHFAVFRGSSGKVHILDAYCPHLGANMAEGGAVKGDCLECPFHKWTFDGATGSCTGIPYSQNIPEFAKAKTWPSIEMNGLIFVWYHCDGDAPSWEIQENPCIDEWKFHGRTEIIVSCHIQDIPENGSDIGHLNALHGASFLGGSDLRECDKPLLQFMRHNWKAAWSASTEEPHKGLLTIQQETVFWNSISLGLLDLKVQQIGPGYVELAMKAAWGSMLLVQTVTPISPLRQRVLHHIYAPWWSAPFSKITLWAETIMFVRDVMVWNYKTYISKPILLKEDKFVGKHRRWYSQFYSKNSKRFTFQDETLDW